MSGIWTKSLPATEMELHMRRMGFEHAYGRAEVAIKRLYYPPSQTSVQEGWRDIGVALVVWPYVSTWYGFGSRKILRCLFSVQGYIWGTSLLLHIKTFKTFPNRPLISYSHFIFRNFRPVMGRALSGIPIYYNIYISLSLSPSLPPSPPLPLLLILFYVSTQCFHACWHVHLIHYLSCALRMAQD